MRYRFTCNYKSGAGSWSKGDEEAFDDTTAAWLLRDVAGCIVAVDAPDAPDATEAASRALDTPAHDRQLKKAPRTR